MVGALNILSAEDHRKVDAAVAEAQARTHVRFALVVVRASDRYRFYPVVWGAVLALIVFGAIAAFYPGLGVRLSFAAVSAIFVVASLLLEWLPLRILVVPKRAKHQHARALAHREFAARILADPQHRGGVVFFVSLAERYAEIIADHALHQAAGQAAWDRIVADFTSAAAGGRLADGFVAGAKACGAVLEEHRAAG